MPMPSLSAALAAALLSLASAASAEVPGSVLRDLESWLDRHSPYPARQAAPVIEIVSASVAADRLGRHTGSGGTLRGLYDPETATITLVAPWSADDAVDRSVLLHELIHHRQHTARHWVCAGAQELPAYKLQDTWLDQHGAAVEINWMAAVLEAGCSRRDHHPD